MAKFNILITDHIAEEGLEILKADADVNADFKPGISNDEIKKILGGYDAIITRSGTTVTADLLENTGKLKIVGRAGVGLDNVDIEAASKKGLIVMNAPTGNTISAVELTMGMMLSCARKIAAADQSVRSGKWDRKKFMGIQLQGKTLAIIGLGRIGGNVATRAKAFGMKVISFDPYIKKSRADALGVTLCNTLYEALEVADFVTLHTPMTEETKEIISAEAIGKMKDGAILINCARGGLINNAALCAALESGKLYAAGTDVYEVEPPAADNPLLTVKNMTLTPHIGANTNEGQKGVAVIICEEVLNALHGRPYQYAVNMPFEKARLEPEMQLYFDLAEKLGRLAGQLTKGRVEELRIIMAGKHFEEDFGERTFDTPFSFQPFTVALAKGYLEMFLQEDVSYINAPYTAKDRGIIVTETKVESYQKKRDHLILVVKTDEEEVMYSSTVFPDGTGRIVQVGPFNLDLYTKGTVLYFRNEDTPGIVGKVGTLLGEYDINIANFELSRIDNLQGGQAVAFVSVDGSIPQVAMDKLLKVKGMIEAKVLYL